MTLRRVCGIAYWVGMLGGMIFAFASMTIGTEPADPLWFAGLGFGVVILLFLFSMFLGSAEQAGVGERIQTAGYLYTLLGFIVVLAHFRESSDAESIVGVLAPMGTALGTSVLGWFLGGEVIQKAARAVPSTREQGQLLVDEIESFASVVASARQQFSKQMKAFHKDIDKLHHASKARIDAAIVGFEREHAAVLRSHADALETAMRTLADKHQAVAEEFGRSAAAATTASAETNRRLDELLDAAKAMKHSVESLKASALRAGRVDIETPIARLEAQVGACSVDMSKVRDAAKTTADYLAGTRILIEELKRLIDAVAEHRDDDRHRPHQTV